MRKISVEIAAVFMYVYVTYINCVPTENETSNFNNLLETQFSDDQYNSTVNIFSEDDKLRLQMTTNTSKNFRDPCLYVGSCEYNERLQKPGCYCDAYCSQLNDCCFNHIKSDIVVPFSNTTPIIASCHNLANSDNHGYAMVTKCSIKGKNTEFRRQCESSNDTIYTTVPVTDNKNITYKNRYCALCNGVSKFIAWNIEINPSINCNEDLFINHKAGALLNKTSILNWLIKQSDCELVSVPPKYLAVRSCWHQFGNLARNHISNTTHLCSSYQNPFEIDQKVYKNFFCLLSEKVTAEKYECHNATKLEENGLYRKTVEIKMPVFSGYGHETCSASEGSNQASTECPACETDEGTGTCREIIEFKNFYIRELFQLCANISVSEDHFRLVLALYAILLPIHDYTVDIAFKAVRTMIRDDLKVMTTHRSCLLVNMTITALSIEGAKIQEFLALENQIKSMRFSYLELSAITNIKLVKMNVSKSLITSELTSSSFTSFELKNSDVIQLQRKIRMGMFKGKRLLKVPRNLEIESRVILKGKTNIDHVLITSWKTYFNYDVKKPFFVVSTSQTKSLILRITTYITMGISSLALIATIMGYVYVGMVDRTAARISIHMMGTMLTAHVLFLFGIGASDVSVICLIVGVLIHYIWLSSFAWMSCFVMHAAIDFEKMRKYPAQIHSPNRKLSAIIYSVGYGIPFFIVCPSLILEFYPFTDFDISHTGDACFIKGYPWSIVFFSGPVIFSLVVNLISAITSIRSINKFVFIQNNEETRSVRYLKAYMKLCILSGFSWCLGIISDITRNDVIEFLFVFLSGSHGLCVCLCFVCSSSFLHQLRIATETRRQNGKRYLEALLSISTSRASNMSGAKPMRQNCINVQT